MLPPEGFETVEIIEAFAPPDTPGFSPELALTGGHNEAQLPVHATFPPFSGVNAYRVRPCSLTSTVPRPEIVRVEIAAIVVGAVEVAGVDEADAGLELELLLPQAAASRASGRTVSRARDVIRASLDERRVEAARVRLPVLSGHYQDASTPWFLPGLD
jgi:hypothetical protein